VSASLENQPAYILHRRPYKETSYILDLFSLNFGRVSVVAKGLLKSKPYKSAQLQVFQPLVLSWSGRSELKTLINVDVPSAAFALKGKFLYCAYYLNELLLNLSAESEANPILFSAYSEALQSLSDKLDVEPNLRRFESRLLVQLGLSPDYGSDSLSHEILDDRRYYLSQGGAFVQDLSFDQDRSFSRSAVEAGFIGGDTIKLLVSDWLNFGAIQDEGQKRRILLEAKYLMRGLIDQALQGKPLLSRDLFKQMQLSKVRNI